MAVIKAVSSKAGIGHAIDYVTKKEKTEEKLVSGIAMQNTAAASASFIPYFFIFCPIPCNSVLFVTAQYFLTIFYCGQCISCYFAVSP